MRSFGPKSVLHLIWTAKPVFPYLYVLRSYSTHARNPQDETYCIEDVGFPTAIKTCNGVEALVPSTDYRSYCIGFEAVDDNFYDLHVGSDFVNVTQYELQEQQRAVIMSIFTPDEVALTYHQARSRPGTRLFWNMYTEESIYELWCTIWGNADL